jgi:stearoyl-CoA desaturase (delta-9 desaturase)
LYVRSIARSRSNTQEPLFEKFSDVFEKGFTIDWGIATFLVISHLSAPGTYPNRLRSRTFRALAMGCSAGPCSTPCWVCLDTTAYSHRTDRTRCREGDSLAGARCISVLSVVCGAGQRSAAWAAQHVVHHSVDRTANTPPPRSLQCNLVHHGLAQLCVVAHGDLLPSTTPNHENLIRAFESKSEPALVWQDKHYLPLMIVANYVLPFALGLALADGSVVCA